MEANLAIREERVKRKVSDVLEFKMENSEGCDGKDGEKKRVDMPLNELLMWEAEVLSTFEG